MFAFAAQPSKKNLALLFFVTFLIRAATFSLYVQYEERYCQADSPDYHYNAVRMTIGQGMTKANGQPVFWRTPGYPWYLSWFYKHYGIKSGEFSANAPAQKAAIWVQIFLSSFIPVIIFFLALSLLNSLAIAWITAWICAFHLGLILASCFLLTESLAFILFYLFLLFFFKAIRAIGEAPPEKKWAKNIMLASLFLGIATWIRPMGEFVAIACSIMILLIGQDSWKLKLKKIGLFLACFYIIIIPWCIRNYEWTGKWFYTPMMGTYLNSFVAPKVLTKVYKAPLLDTWKYQQKLAAQKAYSLLPAAQASGKALVLEYTAGAVAWPVIMAHPFIAAWEWIKEVLKTAFDLYACQLTAFASNSFKWDPLEEFFFEKLSLCLYKQPMSLGMRLLCWLDFIYTLWLWLSIFAGIIAFLIIPLFKRFQVPDRVKSLGGLWLKCLFLSGSIMFMTGGFGYARLRLPVEPLMIVLALSFWAYRRQNR